MGDISRLPFPVAYPLHWTRDSAAAIQIEGRRRNAIFTAFQAMRLSALLMLSDYLAYEGATAQEDRELARHIRGLRFPHWQEWTRLANGLAKFWSRPQHRDHAAFPRIVGGWRAVAVESDPALLPLIAGWRGPGGSPAARTANDAIWELRNRSAHREGVATPELQREIEAETTRLLPLVEAIVDRLFGDGSLEIVRSFTDPADGTLRVIRLVGPHADLVFAAEPCDPRWAAALAPTAVAALVGDRAIAVYPFLVPTDDPESRLATGIDEPVAMIDGVSEARLTVMGVKKGATLKNEHLQATLAALRARHGDLDLGRRDVQPWTVAAWSRMTAQQTLDDLRDVKYFPAFHLERPGVDDLVKRYEETSGRGLLLIGEAGSGKSSLIARLVDRLLSRSAPGTDEVPSPDLVVYLTGAADYAGDAGMAGERLMASVVARKLGARADDFASLADLLRHLDAARSRDEEHGRRIWLLFDALNEADRFVDLVRAVDAVLPLLKKMPNLRLVLSIRSGAYHALAARDQQLGVHRTEVLANADVLLAVPDAAKQPRPYLDVRHFSEEHEGRQAYELRRTALPGRAADIPYDRLSQQLRKLLLVPLYLHLFHEAFSARADDGAVLDLDEAGLLDAYLHEIANHQAGVGRMVDRLGEDMLAARRAFLPVENADAWIDEWYRANRFASAQAVATLDPIEELVSASVLVRPTEEGVGADRRLTGYRFVQQRLAERVLPRAPDAPIAPRRLPSADDLRHYAAEAAGPPVFEDLVGALADGDSAPGGGRG